MSRVLILMIDDDAELSGMVSCLLTTEGWDAHTVLTLADGDRALQQLRPDVLLLDLMLPDGNGLDACRRWRAQYPPLGILILTARGDPIDRVVGLEIGADDYLPKPFERRELVARVRALLRRQSPERQAPVLLRFNGLTIDLLHREARSDGQAVALTGVEFKLLVALARASGQPLTRDELSAAAQDGPYRPLDRTIDVQVGRLRRKLADCTAGQSWIDTVRGQGYAFVPRRA